MRVFFEQDHKIPRLTTIECLNMLEEERHHTDFLDGLKKAVYDFLVGTIRMMISTGRQEYPCIFAEENDYFDRLIVLIDISVRNDYNNRKHTSGAFYNSGPIENGKLHMPQLDISVAVGPNGEIPLKYVDLIIDHEINHLYDEWQWQSTGHESLTGNAEWNHGDGAFIQENLNSSNALEKALAWSVYASLWTESNSYVNQAFKEFKYVKLRPHNLQKKLKTTISYRNFSKQLIDLKWFMQESGEETVRETVLAIYKRYGRVSIPKPSNGGSYVDRLTKWSEGIYNKFMKRYCGIASLYIERNFGKTAK